MTEDPTPVPPEEPEPRKPARRPRPSDGGQGRRGERPRAGERQRFDGGRSRTAAPRDAAGDRGRMRGGAGRLDAAQPFRPPRKPGPRQPVLPEERPRMPREAYRDLKATVPAKVLEDVIKAVGAAAEAMESEELVRATELLTWAKSVAPRSSTVREALGIAHYGAERYAEAHAELLTYRRLSANQDQNHLLADCARALGRPEKMVEYVEAMIAAGVSGEPVAEGLLVLAGERADRGDPEEALRILGRAGLDAVEVQPWHPRLWYLAGHLSEELGRTDQARDYFEAILAVDPDFGDVEERLAALD